MLYILIIAQAFLAPLGGDKVDGVDGSSTIWPYAFTTIAECKEHAESNIKQVSKSWKTFGEVDIELYFDDDIDYWKQINTTIDGTRIAKHDFQCNQLIIKQKEIK